MVYSDSHKKISIDSNMQCVNVHVNQTISVCVFACVYVCRWEELNSLAEQRRKLLAGAEQVHRFIRDAIETNDRMNEKVQHVN